MEFLSDLFRAESAHHHVASIRYRRTAAKLPDVKDLDAFVFENILINEGPVLSLHVGPLLPRRGKVMLVGGTGPGKSTSPARLPPALSAPVPAVSTLTSSIW